MARADRIVADDFRLVGIGRELKVIDWRSPYPEALWTYHLHYFDYAVDLGWAWRLTSRAIYLERFEELVAGWIDQVGGGSGPGWDPFPISVRTMNWCRAAALFGSAMTAPFRTALAASIATQLAWLARRLEHHLQGNHLLKNRQALWLGSRVLEGGESNRSSIDAALLAELRRQVLADGGHVERSPMYHALVLEDLIETAELDPRFAAEHSIGELVSRMTAFLERLSRPDGTLHRFNDAADGQTVPADEIVRWARAGIGGPTGNDGAFAFPDSGYFGWTGAAGRFVIDAGIPGPAEQPAHAHCDIGSFELDVGESPLVIDSGVHGYGGDRFREYSRSTRGHNTVSIAGREQSEMWDTFRVARKAHLGLVNFDRLDSGAVIQLSYQPYGTRFTHHRRATYLGGVLEVDDRVANARGTTITSWLHFAPEWSLEPAGDAWIARTLRRACRIQLAGAVASRVVTGKTNPVQGWTFPQFGVAVPSPTLELTLDRYDDRPFGYRIEEIDS